ncbi:SRPBCC family protein [Pseudomonas putida]
MTPRSLKGLATLEQANVVSLHQRVLPCSEVAVGCLLAGFAAPGSALWPEHAWPRDRFDGPMREGSIGGHGSTRYRLERYLPGDEAVFRFIAPRGYQGVHGFRIQRLEDGRTRLSHFTCLHLSPYHWLMWHVLVRWVHDALIGDLLDGAEQHLCASVRQRRRWKWRVYLIRHALGGARVLAEAAGLKRRKHHASH